MARSQYTEVVTYIDSGALKPANNARVSVFLPGTTTPVTIFTTRTAGTTKSNPFTTGSDGMAEFWAEWGEYDIKYEDLNVPARFGTKTFGWSSTSGIDDAVPLDALDAETDRQFAPIGAIINWWRPNNTVSLPTGWVECDGSSYGSSLHDFGTGASITVPDLRNKFILGASSSITDGTAATTGDASSNAPGIRGSGSSHSKNLSHTHSITAESPGTNSQGNHNHTFSGTTANNPLVFGQAQAYTSGSAQKIIGMHGHDYSGTVTSGGAHSHTVNSHSHGGATGSGGSGAQDIKPLYVGLLFIIKIKRD